MENTSIKGQEHTFFGEREYVFFDKSLENMSKKIFDMFYKYSEHKQNSYKNYIVSEEKNEYERIKSIIYTRIEKYFNDINDVQNNEDKYDITLKSCNIYAFANERIPSFEDAQKDKVENKKIGIIYVPTCKIKICKMTNKEDYLGILKINGIEKLNYENHMYNKIGGSFVRINASNTVDINSTITTNSLNELINYLDIPEKKNIECGSIWVGKTVRVFMNEAQNSGLLFTPVDTFPINLAGIRLARKRGQSYDMSLATMRTIFALANIDIHLRGWKGEIFSKKEQDFVWDERSINEVVKLQMLKVEN